MDLHRGASGENRQRRIRSVRSSSGRRRSSAASHLAKRSRTDGLTNGSPIQESYRVTEPATLLELIIDRSGRSRTAAKRLVASGRISVDELPTTLATERLESGMEVTVHRHPPLPPFVHPLVSIEWSDDDYLVAYKRAGIATVNTAHKDPHDTVLYLLSRHFKRSDPRAKLFMVTRLDKSSEGFVLFARSIEAKERLIRRWSEVVRHQRYALVVEGRLPEGKTFTLTSRTSPDKEDEEGRRQKSDRPTVTVTAEVSPLASSAGGELHLVEADVRAARIFSMRKIFGDNHLRIFGDIRYHSHFFAKDRIALTQTGLELTWPHTGETLRLTRPIPHAFRVLLRRDKGEDARSPEAAASECVTNIKTRES